MRDLFAERASPIEVVCRVNAGPLGAGSWYQDSEEGGWRIVSEGCHFVDLIQFICGCPPVRVYVAALCRILDPRAGDAPSSGANQQTHTPRHGSRARPVASDRGGGADRLFTTY